MREDLTLLTAQLEALDQLETPLWFYDLDSFTMRWANRSALELWDAPTLEILLGRNFSDVTEATRIRLQSYREGFAQGRTYVERWTLYPKGKPIVVECHCRQARLPGLETAMLVEGRPVPTAEGERDALRMIEALRHTQVMIGMYDRAGIPVLRNPAAVKMFGATDAAGDTLWSQFVDPAEAARLKTTLAEGRVYSAEVEQITLQGPRWVGIDARMTTDPVSGEELILLNHIDITRRRQAEEMRNKAVIEAEHASRARSRFLANVSHELRTPMNGVIGMTDLLLRTPLDDEQRHYVETIQNSGQSLLSIIDDILDFSKIDAGRLDLREQAYDLVDTIRQVGDIVSGTLADKSVRIESSFATGLPERLLGDSNRMKQIILNLTSNAAKFTTDGTVTIRALLAGPRKERLRIEVQDTGIGIAEEDQPKLFQSFSQIDNRDARLYKGTGLGLAICRQLVTMMHGEIGVSSRLGTGSLFWFEVPLRKAVEQDVRDFVTVMTPREMAARQAEGLRVLLVEDNIVNQRVAAIMLGKLGHQVHVAPDGHQGILAASAERFDIIFMDIQMPDVDGYTATQAIRAAGLNIRTPIVALTANAMEGDEKQCIDAGMDGYLSKPVTFMQLAAAIDRYVPSA